MSGERKFKDLGLDYFTAAHGMQAGVQFEMNDPTVNATEPKHLRVGINAAMSQHAALVNLLMRKGIINGEEYMEEIRLAMNDELARYEEAANKKMGGGNRIKFR